MGVIRVGLHRSSAAHDETLPAVPALAAPQHRAGLIPIIALSGLCRPPSSQPEPKSSVSRGAAMIVSSPISSPLGQMWGIKTPSFR